MAKTAGARPDALTLRSTLAKLQNLLRSSTAVFLDDPNPFDILRSDPAEIVGCDPVQPSARLAFEVVVCRFEVRIFDHVDQCTGSQKGGAGCAVHQVD